MKIISAPSYEWVKHPTNDNTLFLAGGITGCPTWQSDMVKHLADADLTIFNPRRENFPIEDPKAAAGQIKWEYAHLRAADAISFWFPKETLCPITLFELGAQMAHNQTLFVGTHPEYQRRQDVLIQLSLAKPQIVVVSSIEDLAWQIKRWVRTLEGMTKRAVW